MSDEGSAAGREDGRGAPIAGAPPRVEAAVGPNPLARMPIEFEGSFPDPTVRLEPPLPEVALIGRSNVGKSSLLNAVVGRKQMARVSATPGKTTLLNVYRLPHLRLVDLPGYGFARAGKTARAGYRKLVEGYLRRREPLAGVVWLLDVRHDPSADDRVMQELLAESGRAVLVVLTKADKVGRQQQVTRVREMSAALGITTDQIQLVSSAAGQGIAELGASILAAVADEEQVR